MHPSFDGRMTGATHTEVIQELREPTRDLRHAIPDVWQAFGELHHSAVADGAVRPRALAAFREFAGDRESSSASAGRSG